LSVLVGFGSFKVPKLNIQEVGSFVIEAGEIAYVYGSEYVDECRVRDHVSEVLKDGEM
jgi:hypothetical protein